MIYEYYRSQWYFDAYNFITTAILDSWSLKYAIST